MHGQINHRGKIGDTMQKLYCYADETGQDAKGELFLVVVVISSKGNRDLIAEGLLTTEKGCQKGLSKWHSTSLQRKIAYLQEVLRVKELRESIYYASFQDTKDYLSLTASTIAQAVLRKTEGENYQPIIVIDGLNKAEQRRVAEELRRLNIRGGKVRGARFRSDTFIRLADALAGFLRDS